MQFLLNYVCLYATDERRDKPIVAPAHFGVTSTTKLSSKIGL